MWPHSAGVWLGAAEAGVTGLSLPGVFHLQGDWTKFPYFLCIIPREQGALHKCSSMVPSFAIFADVPVVKAGHMAKGSINVGQDGPRSWIHIALLKQ